jgi:threonine aldolase
MLDLEDARLEPQSLLRELDRRGVRMTQFGPRRLRAVTHMDVDDEAIERAVAALTEAVHEAIG